MYKEIVNQLYVIYHYTEHNNPAKTIDTDQVTSSLNYFTLNSLFLHVIQVEMIV